MNEIHFQDISVSNEEEISVTNVENDTANAARELLKNGILVETNKGLVCLSLKDALNEGVGGHNLSEEDFQNVATELLYQEEPTKTISFNKKTPKHMKKLNVKIKPAEPIDNTVQFPETLIGFSQILETNSDIIPPLNVPDKIFMQKPNNRSLILKNKPVISVQEKETKYKTNKFGSMLIDPNSLIDKVHLVQENYISCEENSDNSEVTSVLMDDSTKPAKKRGGWPKGRKRKPEIRSEIRPPKAPATGYVIFLNKKRKDYRDMPFTEVTKLLGNEWSRLSLQEKKVYLDQAEVEKKRYREELKSYRQSEAYQIYLHKKRQKRLQGNGTEESDMDATDEIDDEDNEELYCRSCDQWFHSLHNKKEHLYGRQHLQSIANRCTRVSDQDMCSANMSSTSLDESSLDGSSYLNANKESCCSKNNESLNMDDAMVRLMVANKEREEERKLLRTKKEEAKAKNAALSARFQNLNKCMEQLTAVAENEKQTQALLEQRLFNLLNVPTMFYLPEAAGDENI